MMAWTCRRACGCGRLGAHRAGEGICLGSRGPKPPCLPPAALSTCTCREPCAPVSLSPFDPDRYDPHPYDAHQILNNLLGNASKFTRRGQIRVSARQVEAGRKVAVTVSDTGIGIPRNKLATIFLPFEQVRHERPGFATCGANRSAGLEKQAKRHHGVKLTGGLTWGAVQEGRL